MLPWPLAGELHLHGETKEGPHEHDQRQHTNRVKGEFYRYGLYNIRPYQYLQAKQYALPQLSAVAFVGFMPFSAQTLDYHVYSGNKYSQHDHGDAKELKCPGCQFCPVFYGLGHNVFCLETKPKGQLNTS